MVKKLALFMGALVWLASCAPPSGVLVSRTAEPLGGSLFVETMEDGTQFLALDGPITPETSYVFQAMAEANDLGLLVVTQSPGGDLLAAHQIGKTLHEKRMDIMVFASCISACVDIFIAGRERLIHEEAVLGLHAASDPEFGYSVDAPYWESFGFGTVNDRAYEVSNGDLWVLSPERAMKLGLATEVMTEEG